MSLPTFSFLVQLDYDIFCSAEYLPLTFDLNDFKSRVNRHLYILVVSNQLFYMIFTFVFLFFCNSMPFDGHAVLRGVDYNFSIKLNGGL